MPDTQRRIDAAVQLERDRCVKLLEVHLPQFAAHDQSLAIRIRNLIHLGISTDDPSVDFTNQLFDEPSKEKPQ